MRKTYQILAWVVAALVIVQAAAMVYAISGMNKFIDDGGVIDKGLVESEENPFPEVVGFMIHALNGTFLIPLLALVLMGVSFGAHFAGAKKWAGIVLALTVLQVALGYTSFGASILGLLHGANALLLFGSALYAGRLAGSPDLIDMREQRTAATQPR